MGQVSASASKSRRVLLAWVAAPFVVLSCLALSSYFESCANEVLSELHSPDGKYRVVLFERKCSNTVAWVTHASVLPASAVLPNSQGNALVSFERHGSLTERGRQAPEVQARWFGSGGLVLSYSEAAPVQRVVTLVEGVQVVHTRTR